MFDGLRLAHWKPEARPDGVLVLTLDRADENEGEPGGPVTTDT